MFLEKFPYRVKFYTKLFASPSRGDGFAAVFIPFLELILIPSKSASIPEFVMPCWKWDKQGRRLCRKSHAKAVHIILMRKLSE